MTQKYNQTPIKEIIKKVIKKIYIVYFEKVWSLYPHKKGKGAVSKKDVGRTMF